MRQWSTPPLRWRKCVTWWKIHPHPVHSSWRTLIACKMRQSRQLRDKSQSSPSSQVRTQWVLSSHSVSATNLPRTTFTHNIHSTLRSAISLSLITTWPQARMSITWTLVCRALTRASWTRVAMAIPLSSTNSNFRSTHHLTFRISKRTSAWAT